MFLLNPIDNLRLIVGGSVGKFLPRQRENNAGVVSSWLQFRSGAWFRDFKLCPFAPEINPGCCLQNVGDVRAADARRNFQKVELLISFAFDELSVRRSGFHIHRLNQTTIDLQEPFLVRRIVRNRLRNVCAAAVCDLQRWPTVLIHACESYSAIVHQWINVKYLARDKPTQHMIRSSFA